MPVTMEILDDVGVLLRRTDAFYEPADAVWRTYDYPVLYGVDLNGNTVFNSVQVEMLRNEAELLMEQNLTVNERRALEALVTLCGPGPLPDNQYLWFWGD